MSDVTEPELTPPATTMIAVRLKTEGLKVIDEMALAAKCSRSAMVRQLLREAVHARRTQAS